MSSAAKRQDGRRQRHVEMKISLLAYNVSLKISGKGGFGWLDTVCDIPSWTQTRWFFENQHRAQQQDELLRPSQTSADTLTRDTGCKTTGEIRSAMLVRSVWKRFIRGCVRDPALTDSTRMMMMMMMMMMIKACNTKTKNMHICYSVNA